MKPLVPGAQDLDQRAVPAPRRRRPRRRRVLEPQLAARDRRRPARLRAAPMPADPGRRPPRRTRSTIRPRAPSSALAGGERFEVAIIGVGSGQAAAAPGCRHRRFDGLAAVAADRLAAAAARRAGQDPGHAARHRHRRSIGSGRDSRHGRACGQSDQRRRSCRRSAMARGMSPVPSGNACSAALAIRANGTLMAHRQGDAEAQHHAPVGDRVDRGPGRRARRAARSGRARQRQRHEPQRRTRAACAAAPSCRPSGNATQARRPRNRPRSCGRGTRAGEAPPAGRALPEDPLARPAARRAGRGSARCRARSQDRPRAVGRGVEVAAAK